MKSVTQAPVFQQNDGCLVVESSFQDAERLIQALNDPRVYPHPVERVEQLETHISWVLLAGGFAYKFKKPVDLGFADFSSLEKRRRFCDEELRLNRRLCPEIYLGVCTISGSVAQPLINGTGTPIEYGVRMKRFEQDQLLSRMIERGELHAKRIDSLAEQVAAFHASIPADVTSDCGTPDVIREFTEQNFEAIRECECRSLDRRQVDELLHWTHNEYAGLEDTFRSRKAEGFIRECHGDMHLGNMVADGDGVLIFDCIEFNDRLRWIDVIDESAFVMMDLEDRGRADYALRFLNRYLSRSGDYAGLRLLPFYLVYRAMVRAKVAMLRWRQIEADSEEARDVVAECRGYLELAQLYSQPRQPTLSITHGLSGSGKTTGSQRMLEERRAIRIRTDIERKRVLGIEIDESTHPDDRQHAYSREITQQTYDRVRDLARQTLAAGYSVIADATFLKRQHRDAFRALADELGVPFQILDFETDISTLRTRIQQRQQTSHDASEADLRVLEQQIATEEPLEDDELPFVMKPRVTGRRG